jgi:thiol-disulfide isomerase/thioredoxin/outer membrane lipoprotein-sorting protein
MAQRILLFAALSVTLAFAQATPSTPGNSKGLDLLNQVCNKYRNAKSYYIESAEERTTTSELRRSWQKTILLAAGGPEKQYHYEGRTDHSNAVRESDGNTVWTYHVGDQRYTAKPVSTENTDKRRMIPMQEMAEFRAQNLRQELAGLARPFNSAEWLHDQSLKINGHKVRCHVIRVRSADEKRSSLNSSFEKTLWIDRTQLTVVRIVEHRHVNPRVIAGGVWDSMDENSVTTFSKTILDGPVEESLFHFVPPPEAKLLDEFPDPRTSFGANLVGEQAPPLKLKSANGQIQTLDSFRGKPVLIDLWATWCGPCVQALPKLNQLYQEAAKNGLVLISVDRDEEAKTASDFLAKKGYAWPNFHDDGEIEKLVGSPGIPRTLLIDAQGKVVYDATGGNEDALRTQIAKLGPEYAPLAPKKDKDAPCPASE